MPHRSPPGQGGVFEQPPYLLSQGKVRDLSETVSSLVTTPAPSAPMD